MNGMSLRFIEKVLSGNAQVSGNDGIFGFTSRLHSIFDDYRKTLAKSEFIPESNGVCYLKRSGTITTIGLSSGSVFHLTVGDNCIVKFSNTSNYTVLIFDRFGNIDSFEGNSSTIQRVFPKGTYKIVCL